MNTFDRKIPQPTAEQAEATGGAVVNDYLASVAALLADRAIRAAVVEALFTHAAVQRKIRQHVVKQLAHRGRGSNTWEADDLYSLAQMAFIEFVDRFDPTRENASFLGGLDFALRPIGNQLLAERSELTADAIAGRAKRRRAAAHSGGAVVQRSVDGDWFFADASALDSAMCRNRRDADLFDEVFDGDASPVAPVDAISEAFAIMAVADLTDRERAVTLARLELASDEGFPPTDKAVAAALGIGSSTVQRANVAAQRKLRRARALLAGAN